MKMKLAASERYGAIYCMSYVQVARPPLPPPDTKTEH